MSAHLARWPRAGLFRSTPGNVSASRSSMGTTSPPRVGSFVSMVRSRGNSASVNERILVRSLALEQWLRGAIGPMRAVAAALKHRCWLAHHAAPRLGAEFVSVRRETVEAGQVFGANCLGPVSRLSVRQSAHETGPPAETGCGVPPQHRRNGLCHMD